jgi:hypothetical protein
MSGNSVLINQLYIVLEHTILIKIVMCATAREDRVSTGMLCPFRLLKKTNRDVQ